MGRSPKAPPALTASSSLTAQRRAEELARAISGEPVIDLLVIGGGITGVGIALDGATRGLRTVLIEAEDLAFGTSRWSSKLIHGGLRYLASGDIAVAYECAVERGRLLRFIAPHLVRSTPMVLPLLPWVTRKKAVQMGAGIVAGDILRRAAHTASRAPARTTRKSRRPTIRRGCGAASPTAARWGLESAEQKRANIASMHESAWRGPHREPRVRGGRRLRARGAGPYFSGRSRASYTPPPSSRKVYRGKNDDRSQGARWPQRSGG